jgi:hypothetical protein
MPSRSFWLTIFMLAFSIPSLATANIGDQQAIAFGQGQIAPLADAHACDFFIALNPSSAHVLQGQFATVTAKTHHPSLSCIETDITLAALGVPEGLTIVFSPNRIPDVGPWQSTITVTASSSFPPGTYSITLRGTGAANNRYTPDVIYTHDTTLVVFVEPAMAPSTVTASTTETVTVPGPSGIAGFPIESILAGILAGIGALVIFRRRKHGTS